MSKLNFLSKLLGKRPILIGLSIHFALWWTYLVVLFWADLSWKEAVGIVILPAYAAIDFSADIINWGGEAAGVLISLALIGMTLLSVRKQRWWAVLLAHLAVLFYWLFGWFALAVPHTGMGH